ncbi:MAG TPA: threonine/serine dehydratase [Symbiobacteriaceae bacterium]|nr:threonine/serine dehydratase [Symbiobacteriaceae bacterium]
MLTISDFKRAEEVVRRYFPPTPVIFAPRLSERLGTPVHLKLDCFTPVRTFKIRGALNKVQHLTDAGITGGVVTASAGNHGLAVARAARLFGRPAVICVPEGANPQKKALIEAEGARVVESGRDYQAAFENCLRIGQEEGLSLVHAYDDPSVIAGQGTIGLELVSAGLEFDTVVMGIGGGGLIAGVAAVLKTLKPEVQVIGVQPEGADSMIRSVRAGEVVALEKVTTIADGLGARKPGEHTLSMTRQFVNDLLPVSDDDLWAAMRCLLHEERIVAEPAGAAGTAALMRYGATGMGRVVILVSGANIADAVFQRILEAQG